MLKITLGSSSSIVISGLVESNTGPIDGAQVDLWNSSRFSTPPELGDPIPNDGLPADFGPVTSGTQYGSHGAWQIPCTEASLFYIRVYWQDVNYWQATSDALILNNGPGAQGPQGYQGNIGIQGPQGYQGPQGSVPTNVFITYGPQAPSSATYQSLPVVWIDTSSVLTPVPVQPLVPTWNDYNSQFTVPSGIVGLDYVWTSGGGGAGQTLTQGATYSAIGTFPIEVVLTPVAQSGYILSSPSQVFVHDFPNPSATSTITSDNFTGAAVNTLVARYTDVANGGTPQQWLYDLGGTDVTHLTSANSVGSFQITSVNQTMDYAPYTTGDNKVALRFLNAKNIEAQFTLLNLPTNPSTQDPLIINIGRRFTSATGASDGSNFSGVLLQYGYNRFRISTGNVSGGSIDLQFGLNIVPPLGTYTVTLVGTTITIYQPNGVNLVYDLSNAGVYKFPTTLSFSETRFGVNMTHDYSQSFGTITSGFSSGDSVTNVNVAQNTYAGGILANSTITIQQGSSTQTFTVATNVPQGTLTIPVNVTTANANYAVPTVVINGSISMGTLSTAIASGASVTSLSVTANSSSSTIPSGSSVVVSQGSSTQTFVTRSSISVGSLSIPVNTATANANYGTSATGQAVVPGAQFIDNVIITKLGG